MHEEMLVKVARALGDPTRFAVLQAVAGSGEIACGDLAEAVGVSQPTASHHLKTLSSAGLVEVRHVGQHSLFQVVPDGLDGFVRGLEAVFGRGSGLPDLGWGVID